MSDHFINLQEVARLGRLPKWDAYALHAIMCHQLEVVDPDEIVAAWNRKQPRAPWDPTARRYSGKYVRELTQITLDFCRAKVAAIAEQQ
jgi:hypothetical protein